jgi:hypothetical protein
LRHFGDRLNRRGKRFTHRGFFHRKVLRDAVQLIGAKKHVTRQRAIHAVTHSSAIGAKNQISGQAILTLATRDGTGSQPGNSFPDTNTVHIPANFYDGACKFVAQDDRRKIAERVVEHVNVCSADAAKSDFNSHLIFFARWLRNIKNIDVTFPASVLHERFHPSKTPVLSRPKISETGVAKDPFGNGCESLHDPLRIAPGTEKFLYELFPVFHSRHYNMSERRSQMG